MSGVVLTAEGISLRVDGATLVDEVTLSVSGGNGRSDGPQRRREDFPAAHAGRGGAAERGRVTLGGVPLASLRPLELARRRALLPQHTLLQFAFRALDVVLMGRYPHRHSSAEEDMSAARSAMEETDTSHLAARLYPTLSGGEQTRVSFARVLAQETPVVMLDEPTVSLDLRHQELVMGVLRSLAGEGAAIVAVLHDLNLAAGMPTGWHSWTGDGWQPWPPPGRCCGPTSSRRCTSIRWRWYRTPTSTARWCCPGPDSRRDRPACSALGSEV